MNDAITWTAKAGRLIQWFGVISLVIIVVVAGVVGINYLITAEPVPPASIVALVLGALFSVAYWFIGTRTREHERWAVVLAWVVGIFALFNFPIGTIIGAFVLYYLYKGRGELAPKVAPRRRGAKARAG